MNLTTLERNLSFWDRFAQWYEKWANRGVYHRVIINEITQMIGPGWKILDIGAGTGVLSIPMVSLGCIVEAIEPSIGMRDIFTSKIASLKIENIEINSERWETFKNKGITEFDLIIACNSLHLTDGGLIRGMAKVFSLLPAYVCLITEINQEIFIDFKDIDSLQNDYNFLYIKNYSVDSSFYFNSIDEVEELSNILDYKIDYIINDEGIAQRDKTDIAVLWWERK